MRSIQKLGLSLSAALLLLCGCSVTGGGSPQPPSALSYATSTAVYTVGMAITPDNPASAGGAVASYSVSPELPAGLSLSTSTGVISGTPTAVTATAGYTVTAANSLGSAVAILSITVNGAFPAQAVPNMGQQITPLAPPGALFGPLDTGLIVNGSHWLAGQAVSTAVSPDGNTLLILTSGYNLVYNLNLPIPEAGFSNEYVFVYDISTPTPVQKQPPLQIPNSYHGIVFDPSGVPSAASSCDPSAQHFYVPGIISDDPSNPNNRAVHDFVHIFTLTDGTWAEEPGLAMPLNHTMGNGLPVTAITNPNFVRPFPAGVAVARDCQTMVVANYSNDTITVFKGGYPWSAAGAETDLRPGKANPSMAGTPGGEYPFWTVVTSDGSTAYVSSIRDREIDVVNLSGTASVTARIQVKGQPGRMTMNQAQTLLYVVEDQSDTVDVIDINPNDTSTVNTVLETIPVIAPPSVVPSTLAQYTGANSNSVTLSPDETQLWVTNGNLNNIAVVALGGSNIGDHVIGLIPTGWYPNSLSLKSFSGLGAWAYVVNGKSPTGANPTWCYGYGPLTPTVYPNCYPANTYNPQLIKAGFQSFQVPSAAQLATLTAQVAANNRFSSQENTHDAAVMAAVRQGVQHVIFIIKENRTYDQILGDLEKGNGDPNLPMFGEPITPNQHQLARQFVTLDNFLATAEVSVDGWPWTTSARAPDVIEQEWPVLYAGRGFSLDSEGLNRNVDVAIPTLAGRVAAQPLLLNPLLSPPAADPDLLPGQTDVAAPDGPNNEVNTGYLWDAALRANLTVRGYGFLVDISRYSSPNPAYSIPLLHDPAASGTIVAYSNNVALTPYTDPYFRGFDPSFPDYYRYTEWEREFDANYASAGLPALSLVRLMHDHTGNFTVPPIDLVDTPETQQADNDYAVGLLVQKIANSVYANNTLIFVVEDDSQDGGDHVDSHRTVALVAGAYVKQGALVSSLYNTLDFLRTIEEVLGLPPMNLNDALARPMADIFNTMPSAWTFTATPSLYLYNTRLPLPPQAGRRDRAQAHARREVLGAGYEGDGLQGRGSHRCRTLQPHSLERDHGQQALSGHPDRIGPAPESRGAPRSLPEVSEAQSGAGSEDGHGLSVTTRQRAHGDTLTRQDLQDAHGVTSSRTALEEHSCGPLRHPSVIFIAFWENVMLTRMAHFPHPHAKSRAPRLCFTAGESISFSVEGKETQGTLQVVSTTGGSARILRPLSPGTLAEISLHLSTGPVSALVEFLPPRPQGRFYAQAFRFVAFGDDDYARFHRTLQMLRAGERMARV